jgi:hypothetical protein
MSSERKKGPTFIELYVNGKVLPEEIDEYVDKWHASPGNQQIYDFLGMSKDEYSLWLRDPDVLPHIVRSRRENKALTEVLASSLNEMPIAARSSDVVKVRRLKRWLEQHGTTS